MSDNGSRGNPSHPPLPNPKSVASPKSPLLPRASREPFLARTNSGSQTKRKLSNEKTLRQKQIQKQFKFSRQSKPELHLQGSSIHSETNPTSIFVNAPLDDSQQTIERLRSRSKDKLGNKNMLKVEAGNNFDVLSRASGSKQLKKSRANEKGEEYYVYWKNKAHQYLETNMKMNEDVRRLTKENEQLKQKIGKMGKTSLQQSKTKISPKELNQEELNKEVRKISMHYLSKIEDLEKELKKKEVLIVSYQAKITELSNKLTGDSERVKLMNKMQQDIKRMQAEVVKTQNNESYHNYSSLQLPTTNTLPLTSPRRPLPPPPSSSLRSPYK